MKPQTLTRLFSGLALLLSIVDAAAQGTFQNLDFESANLAGYSPVSTQIPMADALPHWSAYIFPLPQNYVWYDGVSAGGAAISVIDSKLPSYYSPFLKPIQGNYSVVLFAGMQNGVSSAISQSGLVPSNTLSLQIKMFCSDVAPVITLGGQTVNKVPLQTFSNYSLYGGDVASLAGQVATLSITEPPPPSGQVPTTDVVLDDIVFSPEMIPEPTFFALFVLATMLSGSRFLVRLKVLPGDDHKSP